MDRSESTDSAGRLAGKVVGALALLYVVLVGLGLLITKVLENVPPLKQEDGVDRAFATHREPAATAVSGFFSLVGSTPGVISVMIVVAVVFRLVFKRWRESAFLVLAVAGQALVFLFVTLVISRNRPGVKHLDPSPPTSSFPSGHTGASTALYVGIAVVLAWHTRHLWARRSVVTLLVLVPVCVAVARLYRGMHHPSDVIVAMGNGATCVLVSSRALLFRALPESLAKRLDPGQERGTPARASLPA